MPKDTVIMEVYKIEGDDVSFERPPRGKLTGFHVESKSALEHSLDCTIGEKTRIRFSTNDWAAFKPESLD